MFRKERTEVYRLNVWGPHLSPSPLGGHTCLDRDLNPLRYLNFRRVRVFVDSNITSLSFRYSDRKINEGGTFSSSLVKRKEGDGESTEQPRRHLKKGRVVTRMSCHTKLKGSIYAVPTFLPFPCDVYSKKEKDGVLGPDPNSVRTCSSGPSPFWTPLTRLTPPSSPTFQTKPMQQSQSLYCLWFLLERHPFFQYYIWLSLRYNWKIKKDVFKSFLRIYSLHLIGLYLHVLIYKFVLQVILCKLMG